MNILNKLMQRATAKSPVRTSENRTEPRYGINRAIWFQQPGKMPVAGSVTNISMTGALARVTAVRRDDVIFWPSLLSGGDEIWVSGLLNNPICCWVVAVDNDVLRLRFLLDTKERHQLQNAIAVWAQAMSAGKSVDRRERS